MRIRAFIAAASLAACARDARCPTPQSACESPSDAGFLCADWRSEWSHCGGCYRHCAVGQRCVEGRCATLVCEPNSQSCVDLQTRRECTGDGRNFVEFPCARDTVCAAGRCRAWPEDRAWTPIERDVFDREPDLPDWLVSTRRCGALDVQQSPSRALRIVGPVYARRVLRFGDGAARAVSVRFRSLGSERAELALLSSSGSSMAGVPGCVVARVVAGQLRISLTNGSSLYEQPVSAEAVTVRVEIDAARERVRVWINNAAQRELRLGDFPLLGSYLQVNSAAECDEPAFEIEEVQTWSAP